MLYTRKGDSGTSGLFGTKERFPKDSPVYEALGALDELNSLLGICRARSLHHKDGGRKIAEAIVGAQQCLFVIQAEIAGSSKSLTQLHIDELERTIDTFETLIENPHAFVVPGSTEFSSLLDCARAVGRRAERTMVAMSPTNTISSNSGAYINRLSSLLYALARYAAMMESSEELSPTY
ncbi:MAG: cob(I)yrinic acid a,c-diamide adenosyltransferase [Minisyncoccia bacterium]